MGTTLELNENGIEWGFCRGNYEFVEFYTQPLPKLDVPKVIIGTDVSGYARFIQTIHPEELGN